ncbi:MAG TPA: hypothetical protein VGN52_16890 [Burkholderiales bacterium]
MAQLNGLTRRVVQLRQSYRATLNADFDPRLFWDDAFYASQVLERALRTGPRELMALARPLEEMLAESLESRRSAGGRMFNAGAWPMVHALLRPATPRPPATAHQPERRRAADPGLARLTERDVLLITRLRLQFRRHYGVFFDLLEFTRDDLYARNLLRLCSRSSDLVLRSIARRFYNADGTPRLHRRQLTEQPAPGTGRTG